MNTLMRLDFPGNIRELENIIEYSFVVCRGSILQKEHLPPEILQSEIGPGIQKNIKSTPVTETIDEQTLLTTTLKNCGGKIAEAAEKLGIHRTTLWRKIKRYHIDLKDFSDLIPRHLKLR